MTPERLAQNDRWGKEKWWQFLCTRPEFHAAIAGLARVLVIPQTSNVQALAFLGSKMVFAHTLIVFPLTVFSGFCVLQSRFHQIWSAFLGSTMEDDLRSPLRLLRDLSLP